MKDHKGSFRNPLQLEHKLPRSIYPELTWDLNNVIILCMKDHKAGDTFGKRKIKAYVKKNKKAIELNKLRQAKSKKQ
jgi:5-methylcytosine-specific restriction endonuclease McrA